MITFGKHVNVHKVQMNYTLNIKEWTFAKAMRELFFFSLDVHFYT